MAMDMAFEASSRLERGGGGVEEEIKFMSNVLPYIALLTLPDIEDTNPA